MEQQTKEGILLTSAARIQGGSYETILATPTGLPEPRLLEDGTIKTGPLSRLIKPYDTDMLHVGTPRHHQWLEYIHLVVFSTYRQLWILVVAPNVVAIAVTIARHNRTPTLPLAYCTNAAVANLMLAILVRQDYVKNSMYQVCWSTPHSAPLWLRRKLALVYENGRRP